MTTSTPWSGRGHSFAGWVPNIHSHLSFSLIGIGRGPEVSRMTPAYRKKLRRFVCVMQRRETDDFLAPAWWSRLRRPGATQHFLMVGATQEVQTPVGIGTSGSDALVGPLDLRGRLRRLLEGSPSSAVADEEVRTASDAQGMLLGHIYVMFRQTDVQAAAVQDALTRELRAMILTEEAAGAARRSDSDLDGLPDELRRKVAERSANAVTLRFALFRTGEVRIWYEDVEADRLDPSHRVELARQSYFFVKDMVHHHVHHDPRSDQITPLTEIGEKDPLEGEEHWRRDTVWSLSRAVDALARRGRLQDVREATGILAYADAFQRTLLLYRRRSDEPWSFEPNSATYRYDYQHIRESLKVQLDQITARRTIRAQMIVAGLAGSLAATSLLTSIISARNGALGSKLAGTPVVPAIGGQFLQVLADLPLLPAIVCGAFLWFVSDQLLSEDRIGAKRSGSRKSSQAIRGLANTFARRNPSRDAAWVQRWIERFYLLVVAIILLATIWLTPLIGRLGRGVDAMLSSHRSVAARTSGRLASVSSPAPPDSAATAAPPAPASGAETNVHPAATLPGARRAVGRERASEGVEKMSD